MKKLLLATVAAVPLIAAGTFTASSQDIKQPNRSGMSQSQGRGEALDKPGATQGKAEQSSGKSESSSMNQRATQDKHTGKTEGRASAQEQTPDAAGRTNGRARDQSKSKQQAQAKSKDDGKQDIKQGPARGVDRTAGPAKDEQAPNAGKEVSQDQKAKPSNQASSSKGKQGNEANSAKEPARTTGQANRPTQDNDRAQQTQSGNRGEASGRAEVNGGAEANGRVTLNERQRTKIQETVLSRRDVPRVDRVDFSINVGTAVPTRITTVEVPETLIEIHPEWRGERYFVVRDEIIIVDRSHRIVAMVPVGSGSASSTEIRSTSSAGSADVDIRRVQEVLIEKGFYHGKVDGVLTIETKDALIAFQRRQGIEATGRIDVRTSEALGVSASGRTEGRGDQDRAQGRSEPNNASPATSGQANPSKPSDARDVNGRNDNGKGNPAQERNNERNNPDREGQSTRPATSGQGSSTAGAKGDNADKAAPSTSGQGTHPGESKPGESGKAGSSMRPQNQPSAGNSGASDNQRKQPQ
jgi:hypothetical protein